MFCTGPGISSRHSADLKHWETGPPVFPVPPSWTTNDVPGFRGYFWAPDIIQIGGRYLLYYSVSRWGKNSSAIGLATNATLDPTEPRFGWHDQGMVCESHPADGFNTIDPSVMQAAEGTLWLAFGSFWSGIKLLELDSTSGKRIAADSIMYPLAFHEAIEAACLYEHDGYYYLFVNWGLCCRGTNSTYNIRVGRSQSVSGPYLDKAGQDLFLGGGSPFLETDGAVIGPGHAGICREGNSTWLSFHFYDGGHGGTPSLGIRRLDWTEDNWPKLGAPP